jgi:hypothetical protein
MFIFLYVIIAIKKYIRYNKKWRNKMTGDRVSLVVGKNTDVAELVEPMYQALTGKNLEPIIEVCLGNGVGKLGHQDHVYCVYKEFECPYQKESDMEFPYCEKR